MTILKRRHPRVPWPARSTVGDLLSRHGLIERNRRRTYPSAGSWFGSRPRTTPRRPQWRAVAGWGRFDHHRGAHDGAQLDGRLVGLQTTLDGAQLKALDRVSSPTRGFPIPFLQGAITIMHSGATVDGATSEPWPMAPQGDDDRY